MEKVKIKLKTIFLKYKLDIVFSTLMLFLLIYRITIYADVFDEIINLNVAYRISLGDIPFYQCWEAFQNGDILLAPFLWLYVKVLGSTGGIVLFSRLFYLLCNISLGILVYFSFKDILGKKIAYYLGFLMPFFQIFSLYYLWYDTASILLLTLGLLFLFRALYNKKNKWTNIYLIIAGVCHALMAFVYPTYLLIAVIIFLILFIICWKKWERKVAFKYTCFYILGAMIVIISFLVYLFFYIGFDNFIFVVDRILSYRKFATGSDSILIVQIIKSFLEMNKTVIFLFPILLLLFVKTIKEKRYLFVFIFSIIIVAVINQFALDDIYGGLANFIAIIALWCPFLYFLLEDKKEYHKILMWLIWLPSIITCISISISSVPSELGPVKSWQSFLPAFLATMIFMYDLIKAHDLLKFNKKILTIILTCNLMLLGNYYRYIYNMQPIVPITADRIDRGIYKGIKANDYMKNFVCVQVTVNEYIGNSNTILAGEALRPIYLMTQLSPLVPSVESPNYMLDGKLEWEMTLDYFEKFQAIPDLMVLQEADLNNQDIKDLISEKYDESYNFNCGEIYFTIYKK